MSGYTPTWDPVPFFQFVLTVVGFVSSDFVESLFKRSTPIYWCEVETVA